MVLVLIIYGFRTDIIDESTGVDFESVCDNLRRMASDLDVDTHQLALRIQQVLADDNINDTNLSRSMPAAVKSKPRTHEKDYFIPFFVAVATGWSSKMNFEAAKQMANLELFIFRQGATHASCCGSGIASILFCSS